MKSILDKQSYPDKKGRGLGGTECCVLRLGVAV